MSSTAAPHAMPSWDAEWRHFLTLDRRPNLLICCAEKAFEPLIPELMHYCGAPLHVRCAPGDLNLPDGPTGTLLLWDVARLTLAQQIELQDWITHRPRRAQVVSVTSRPLLPLVERGEFLEGLFYRLNVVSLAARSCREMMRGQTLQAVHV
jgi:sigma-54-interacting transcriptional regulator